MSAGLKEQVYLMPRAESGEHYHYAVWERRDPVEGVNPYYDNVLIWIVRAQLIKSVVRDESRSGS